MTDAPRNAPPREPAVVGLVACLVLVFALQFAFGAEDGPRLARMGASTPKFWTDGHWWTLASSTLLHIGVVHLAFNSYFVWAIGPSIARLTSPARMLTVFFVGGLTGSVLSQLVGGDGISAGASGGAWGLMLAQALLVWVPSLHGYQIRPGAKASLGQLILLNGVISLLPGINGLAHLGGGLGGAAVLWVSQRGGRLWDGVAAALALGHLGAFAMALSVGKPWQPAPLGPLAEHPILEGVVLLSTPAPPEPADGGFVVGELWWEGWLLSWYVETGEPAAAVADFVQELGGAVERLPCEGCELRVTRQQDRDIYVCARPIASDALVLGVGAVADGRGRDAEVAATLCSGRAVR